MPRFKNVNGKDVQLTAQEEAERDAEEAAWSERVITPPLPTLADVIAVLSEDQRAALQKDANQPIGKMFP